MSNLSAADFQFISPSEFRVLERKFNEYSNSNDMGYEEFKEILTSNNKIVKEILVPFLEKVKKKVRENGLSSETEHLSKKFLFKFYLFFILAKNDYFFFMNQLLMENNKYLNERDPELSNL